LTWGFAFRIITTSSTAVRADGTFDRGFGPDERSGNPTPVGIDREPTEWLMRG
jgi:hypothetical protein